MPRLRAAVAAGRIGWTKAQQVARVAMPASEAVWVDKAARAGRREFVEVVKKARANARALRREWVESDGGQLLLPVAEAPGDEGSHLVVDPPVTLSFRLEGGQYARFEALIERIRKRGVIARGATREEILIAVLEALSESNAPEVDRADPSHELRRRNSRPSTQVVVRRCPECEAAAVVTSRGDRQLSRAAAEAASCDARIVDEGGRTHASIPPSVRAAVLVRDGHRCRDCGSRNFLHVHHIVPRCEGGSNKPENLITLCSRCHGFAHDIMDAALGPGAFHLRR